MRLNNNGEIRLVELERRAPSFQVLEAGIKRKYKVGASPSVAFLAPNGTRLAIRNNEDLKKAIDESLKVNGKFVELEVLGAYKAGAGSSTTTASKPAEPAPAPKQPGARSPIEQAPAPIPGFALASSSAPRAYRSIFLFSACFGISRALISEPRFAVVWLGVGIFFRVVACLESPNSASKPFCCHVLSLTLHSCPGSHNAWRRNDLLGPRLGWC